MYLEITNKDQIQIISINLNKRSQSTWPRMDIGINTTTIIINGEKIIGTIMTTGISKIMVFFALDINYKL